MYPQNGTWIYNRGNWCPGDKVFTNHHKLAGITGGSTFDLDVEFENYTSASGNASYITHGNLFYYGAFNNNLDAELEDVIAPSNHETHIMKYLACKNSKISEGVLLSGHANVTCPMPHSI